MKKLFNQIAAWWNAKWEGDMTDADWQALDAIMGIPPKKCKCNED